MIWISYSKVNLILSLLTTILLKQLEKVQEEKPIIHTPVTNTKPSENLEHIEDLLTGIFERLNSAGKLTLLVFVLLREIYPRYRLPLIVTENGLGAYDKLEEGDIVNDPYRIDFLRQHIEQIQLAITDGVEVFGFSPWSAIDLVSTHQGDRKSVV